MVDAVLRAHAKGKEILIKGKEISYKEYDKAFSSLLCNVHSPKAMKIT